MSFSEWKEVRLGDICDIVMGQSPKGESCNNIGNGTPLLNGPTEFGLFHPHAIQFTTDVRKQSMKNDLLFCVRGSTTGRMNWADKEYAIGRGLAAIRHKNGSDYSHFVKGLIDYKLDEILNCATGSTFPNVGRDLLNSLNVYIPPIQEQKSIADTLSCLDDKIELNNNINKTLEEMAQAIFKSWFVDFEPFQDGEFEDSELGRTPKGWIVEMLGDNVKISTKGINPQSKTNIIFEHYSIPAYDDCKMPVFEAGIEIKSNKYIVSNTCFLVSKLNPSTKRIWKPYCITENPICSTEFMVYETINSKYTYFYYSLVNNTIFGDFIKSNVTGSTNSRQRAIPKTTLNFKHICPPEDEIMKFINIVKPIYKKLQDNIIENQSLAKIRDALLPKLMSGEIRVPIEEIQ